MRRIQRNLTEVRHELADIEKEFTRLQRRVEDVRISVAESLLSIFGEERPAFAGLKEEELIERIAERVVARLGTPAIPQQRGETKHVSEKEAAAFLGVSVKTLRSWRSRPTNLEVPFAKVGRRVVYSVEGIGAVHRGTNSEEAFSALRLQAKRRYALTVPGTVGVWPSSNGTLGLLKRGLSIPFENPRAP
jgi:hypothetical protein